MTNKIEESPFQLALRADSDLARTESISVSRLRKALRIEFKRNSEAIGILQSNLTTEEKAAKVTDLIADRFKEVASEDIFRESVEMISEFEKLEKHGVHQIIVNSAGRGVIPMSDDVIYYPTRIDEHGNKSKGLAILHPAVASTLMLQEVESNEISRLERSSPVFAFNMQIERTTTPLETQILQDLENEGWEIKSNNGKLYTEVVGKEAKITFMNRERNPAFSRVPIWSRLFIRSIPGSPREIEIIAIDRKDDGVYRWFEVTYRTS